MAEKEKYVDNGWPVVPDGEHAVSEFASNRSGSLSPFGDTLFPLDPADLPYLHPRTTVNR
ncbi:hypothetical protein [Nocardia sp. 348MFTsu5.1]|uniref:hypothetical protein n=1 Tax=Nocardia sp. 348MFTsu5.1 TaxID=1172185 RepID=UPI00048B3E53